MSAPLLPALLGRLRSVSDPGGFVRFDRFMEVALYGEGVGRYVRTPGPLGPEGDFYTAPSVHPLFGRSLAARIREVADSLGAADSFRIVELGPGDGTLAATVLQGLAEESPRVAPIEYLLVERSRPLADVAVHRAAEAARVGTTHVRSIAGSSAEGPFEGVVIANEFMDAQPVRRLQRTGTGWLELGVRVDGERVLPAVGGPPAAVPGGPLPTEVPDGAVLEISPTAEGLVREVADHLVRGVFIVIDYGMEERELVTARPHGTLAAVRCHRPLPDPLSAPGDSDLSTFVNFSRLRTAAMRAGLREVAFRSQAEALGAWGFPRWFDQALARSGSAEEEVRLRLAAKNLLFGFERFRVLELGAGAGPP